MNKGEDEMLKVIAWIAVGLVVLYGVTRLLDTAGRRACKNLSISQVDFSKLKDGTYTGLHKGGRFSNKVQVTVESGRVTGISIVRDVWFHEANTTKQIINTIIEAQSLQVDAVSGATLTTKAYLKAVENALAGAK